MNGLKERVERRTGTVFGFYPRSSLAPSMPSGMIYLRVGRGEDGLCVLEIGTRKGFFYFDSVRSKR